MEKVGDGPRPPVVTIYAVEDIACGLHRQCWNWRSFAVPGNRRDTRSDTDTYGLELAKFIHRRVGRLIICSLRVKDRLGIVEDYDHLLGRQQGSQGCYILRVFNPRANDLGEAGEEMKDRGREFIAADESTVTAKSLLDPIVVEDSEGNRRFPDPPCTDQGDGLQFFGDPDDLVNEFLTSEAGPWRRGR